MILNSPDEALLRIVHNLYVERVRGCLVRRFLTAEDIAIVRLEGGIPGDISDRAIWPEPLILRLADKKGWSQNRAIAEVGRGLGMISDLDFRELCEELGELTPAIAEPDSDANFDTMQPSVPRFSADGILTYLGTSIKFLGRRGGSAPRQILLAFEAAGWSPEIPFPIPEFDQQRMHEARRRLQDRVSKIDFSVDFNRYRISWGPAAQRTSD